MSKEICDPVELVRDLADKIGINQLYAIARDMRGEPEISVTSYEHECQILGEELRRAQSDIAMLKDTIVRMSMKYVGV